MRLRDKILILLAAVVISLMGFNLLATSAIDLVRASYTTDYEVTNTWMVKSSSLPNHSHPGKS